MYQILPYLEEGAVQNVINTTQLPKIPIALYNCPSRRGITFHNQTGLSLVDYAAAIGGPSRSEIGDTEFNKYMADSSPSYTQFNQHQDQIFWGCQDCGSNTARGVGQLTNVTLQAGKPAKFRGVIQRGDWTISAISGSPTIGAYSHAGYMVKMTDAKITDGTSKTIMVAEKWVHYTLAEGTGGQADDRGWSDGWDFDAVRSTLIQPRSDSTGPPPNGQPTDPQNYPMGSAHSGGINAVFADGSVSFISYDVDLETFNRLGNRGDGETISQSY